MIPGSCSAKLTFNQSVFVSWGGTSKNTKFGPNFVQSLLFNLKGTEKQQRPLKMLCFCWISNLQNTKHSNKMKQSEQVWQQLYGSQYIYHVHFLKFAGFFALASSLPRWPHLSLVVPDLLVELLPLQAQEVFAGRNDATLGCDGSGSVDVVSSNHADCDACALALGDSLRYLQMMSTEAFTDTTKSRHGQTAARGLYIHIYIALG